MNKVYATGDTHIDLDVKKLSFKNWPESRKLTKNDYLIVCGDFGLIWANNPSPWEIYWMKWFNERPYTTLFVDGNHENFYRLFQLKIIEKFGGKVGQVSDSIFHLKRGEIYTIAEKKFFCFGGAESIDKESRLVGISWWKEEVPTHVEMDYGLENLEKHDNKVDFIISHTLPTCFKRVLGYGDYKDKWTDPTCKFLQHLYETIEFKNGFGGHFHENAVMDKYVALFNNIMRIV